MASFNMLSLPPYPPSRFRHDEPDRSFVHHNDSSSSSSFQKIPKVVHLIFLFSSSLPSSS
jgi:hypothetical protein